MKSLQMIFLKWKWLWFLTNIFGFFVLVVYLLYFYKDFVANFEVNTLKTRQKVDWNDYAIIESDKLRVGFGEGGVGEKLTDPDEIAKNKELHEVFGMSVVISDKISVNRSIPDFRHPDCLKLKYFRKLPRVSIIIIFHNEVFSVFKRTLHSLYNRTPHELIREVVLVNDNSTLDFLYDPLKNYIDENFPNLKFNIINLRTRHGLMKARVVGAKAAKSDLIFIMEPHCEMTYNWLPPLIEPLIGSHETVTVPIIDNVEWRELYYYENDLGNLGSRGAFDWNLEYQKLKRFPVDDDEKLDPFPIPIMTGGVFMIHKKYFFEIGPYDEELLIWGAENLEMSFKINLCGGKLLEVPCSRIGHGFRNFNKFRKHESGIDFVAFNRKRIVEVWFDEFKEFVYRRDPESYQIKVGDLTKPKNIRKELNCKPFKYFIEVIAPDLLEKYPASNTPFASGRIELLNQKQCLELVKLEEDSEDYDGIVLTACYFPTDLFQNFELSFYRDIRLTGTQFCIDFHNVSPDICHLSGVNQLFKYNIDTNQIISVVHNKCLQADLENKKLSFEKCRRSLNSQKWIFSDYVNVTALENWNESGRPFESPGQFFWS